MVFKLREVLFSLILTVCCLIPISWAAELTIPLPPDAIQVSENTASFGPIQSVTRIYQSSLTQAQLYSFYQKEMLRAGWTPGREGVFIKNDYMVMVAVSPLKDEPGKINFSSTISNIPAKEEFLALPKTKPVKLNFMPVYPGSVQLSLWNTPIGVVSSYLTASSIKEVVFFYKSGMLDYGWSLDKEIPIKAGAIDCPECSKASTKGSASLIFRRKGKEGCTITIANDFIGPGDLPARGKSSNEKSASLAGKTTISVDYNAYQRIK